MLSDVVKEDVVQLFDDFCNGKLDFSRMNYGIITLLPKVVNVRKSSNTYLYAGKTAFIKLLTKALTIRVEPYAAKLCRAQTVFMKVKKLFQELWHSMRSSIKLREKTENISSK